MSLALDHTGPFTVEDVLALPEDGRHTRYELLEGSLLVTPAPAFDHQLATGLLFRLLGDAARAASAGVVIIQGIDVAVSSGLLIPDICVVAADVARARPRPVPGAAVVAAVEVVSPSSRRMDRMIKPGVYAETGIPTYWRVELEPEPLIIVSTLRDGVYVEAQRATAGERHLVETPFAIELDPAELLDD